MPSMEHPRNALNNLAARHQLGVVRYETSRSGLKHAEKWSAIVYINNQKYAEYDGALSKGDAMDEVAEQAYKILTGT